MSPTVADRVGSAADGLAVVDCDLHVYPSAADLRARLPERFRGAGVVYPDGNWAGSSPVEAGGPAPAAVREYLDEVGVERAVLTGGGPNLRAAAMPETRYAAALTRAYNDWLVEEYLDADGRLLGSVSVAPQAPEAAAEEIRRVGDHPDVVQVVAGAGTQVPLGRERYWPVYEAAEEMGLPVALHAGAEGYGLAHPNTGAGYPSTDVEREAVVPANFMGQLLDLLFEGVFVEFPDLRVVLAGGGFSWAPSFLWRVDKCWKGLRHDVPWLERPPSEYARERVRFASHPLNEPGDDERLRQVLDVLDAEETLLFATDYPRAEHHAPDDPLPDLDPALARAVFSETARELYGL